MNMPCSLPSLRGLSLPLAGLPFLLFLLPGCGGGSKGGSPAPNTPTPTWPNPNPPPTAPAAGPTPGAPAGTNGIGAVVFSQGIQDPTWTTPLVAGRNATVRVFVACPGAGNTQRPTVNVTLWNAAGTQVLNSAIPAPGTGIPTAPLLNNFNDSWNLDIPGTLIQPGTTFQASLVANAQSAGLTQLTWPASGLPRAIPACPTSHEHHRKPNSITMKSKPMHRAALAVAIAELLLYFKRNVCVINF